VDTASCLEKFSWDMILYTSREFGFFSLPAALTTGSSIMPQKHNPDVLELLRARAGKLRACEAELVWVSGKLPSNYHRDLQYTKEPVLRAAEQIQEMLPMWQEVLGSFRANSSELEASMSDELFATYDAYRQVKLGTPFRDAYRITAKRVAEGGIRKEDLESEFAAVKQTCNQEFGEAKAELLLLAEKVAAWQTRLAVVENNIFKLSA
jgi:argininosuccinate lyase